MATVKDIETAVTDLSKKELSQFRKWFEDFDAAEWDQQFEEDVKSGRLNNIAKEALKDFQEGKFKEL